MSTVLITGAGGFIGQELAKSLSADTSTARIILTDIVEPPVPKDSKVKGKFMRITIDLTSDVARDRLFQSIGQDLDTTYLLHGIMSGAAEANLELGYAINLNATMEILRQILNHSGTKVIYASVSPPKSRNIHRCLFVKPLFGSEVSNVLRAEIVYSS